MYAIRSYYDNDLLEENLEAAKTIKNVVIQRFLDEDWNAYKYSEDKDFVKSLDTGIARDKALFLLDRINHLPDDKKFFKKLHKIVDDRKAMVQEDRLDWALAEQLAYASLLTEGHPVRLSGHVITSYSIHYTKLYDCVSPGPRRPIPPFCRSRWLQPRTSRVDRCSSCASST